MSQPIRRSLSFGELRKARDHEAVSEKAAGPKDDLTLEKTAVTFLNPKLKDNFQGRPIKRSRSFTDLTKLRDENFVDMDAKPDSRVSQEDVDAMGRAKSIVRLPPKAEDSLDDSVVRYSAERKRRDTAKKAGDLFEHLRLFGLLAYETFDHLASYLSLDELRILWNTRQADVLEKFKTRKGLFTAFGLLDATSSVPTSWGLVSTAMNTQGLEIESLSADGVKSVVSRKKDEFDDTTTFAVLRPKDEAKKKIKIEAKGDDFTEANLEVETKDILLRTRDNQLFYTENKEDGTTLYWIDKEGTSQGFDFNDKVVSVHFEEAPYGSRESPLVEAFTETGIYRLGDMNTFEAVSLLPERLSNDDPRITKKLGKIGLYFLVEVRSDGHTSPLLMLDGEDDPAGMHLILSMMDRPPGEVTPSFTHPQVMVTNNLVCIYTSTHGFSVYEYKPDHKEEITPYIELLLETLNQKRGADRDKEFFSFRLKNYILNHVPNPAEKKGGECGDFALMAPGTPQFSDKELFHFNIWKILEKELERNDDVLDALNEFADRNGTWDEFIGLSNDEFIGLSNEEFINKIDGTLSEQEQAIYEETLLKAFKALAAEQRVDLEDETSLSQCLSNLLPRKAELLRYLQQRLYYEEMKNDLFEWLEDDYSSDNPKQLKKKSQMDALQKQFSIFEGRDYPGKKWLIEDLKEMGIQLTGENRWRKDFVRRPVDTFLQIPYEIYDPRTRRIIKPVTCLGMHSDDKYLYVHTKDLRNGQESIRFYDHKKLQFTPLKLRDSSTTGATLETLPPMKCITGKNLKVRFEAGFVMITSETPLSYPALKGRAADHSVISSLENMGTKEIIFDPILEARLSADLRSSINKMKESRLGQEYDIIDFKAFVGTLDEPIRLAVLVKAGGRVELFEFEYSRKEDEYKIRDIKEKVTDQPKFQQQIFHNEELINEERKGVVIKKDTQPVKKEEEIVVDETPLIDLDELEKIVPEEKTTNLTYSAIGLTVTTIAIPIITALALTPLIILQPGSAIAIYGFSINISILVAAGAGGGSTLILIAVTSVVWIVDQQKKKAQRKADEIEAARINDELKSK